MKKRLFTLLLMATMIMCLFFIGGVAHKLNLHHYIPGAVFTIDYFVNTFFDPPFFYTAPKQTESEIFRKENVEYPFSFIVYGDSRELAGYEKDLIISKIIEEMPDFAVHTGDITSFANEHQWRIVDTLDGSLMRNGIPVYPVLGNHEYLNKEGKYVDDPRVGLDLYFKRFKELNNNQWYAFKYGNSRFIMLDTNTDYSKGSEQYAWLVGELRRIEKGFLFLVFHHPPYTRHSHRRDEELIIAGLLENHEELGSNKVDAVFSGHIHNYERYRMKGVNYIVTGGGGAEPHELDREEDDYYSQKGPTYHYCKIIVDEDEMKFQMIKLNDSGVWNIRDEFVVRNSVKD